ncbi:MAG: hypothetical protein AAB362_01500 [Patescibacteria group bacterium]
MKSKTKTTSNVPAVGDEIYVDADYIGNVCLYNAGRAKVLKVSPAKIYGTTVHMITVEERPFARYNWEEYLSLEQENLRKKLDDTRTELAKKA